MSLHLYCLTVKHEIMKKSVLVIAMMLMCAPFINAQEYIYFGVKGGVNFSSFTGDGFDDFVDPEERTAFHLGLLAEIPVGERFSIQPEVLYSAQGYDVVSRDGANDVEYQLDYINVPILAKVYLFDKFSIEAGPQIGFLVHEELDYNPTGDGGDITLDEDQFKSVDFAIGLGASYKISNFFVSGRYNIGLSDIYDIEGADAKNSVIQAGVGLMF